jgi:acylphosphatase
VIAKHVFIRGRVQGVGFRVAMIDAAREAGAVGWVRNCRDAAVEAFVQGEASAVTRIVDWCSRGPRGAHVTDVEANEAPLDPALRDFVQRPST